MTETPPSTPPGSTRASVHAVQWLRKPRERLAAIVGVTPDARIATVRAMVARHGKDRIGYWLPLILSMGIATYGLVLGSTGVVIGAMLVSPLMGPLVEIGMGLAVGSPLLVLHSTLRTAASLGVVIGLSALLTLFLPYHERVVSPSAIRASSGDARPFAVTSPPVRYKVPSRLRSSSTA